MHFQSFDSNLANMKHFNYLHSCCVGVWILTYFVQSLSNFELNFFFDDCVLFLFLISNFFVRQFNMESGDLIRIPDNVSWFFTIIRLFRRWYCPRRIFLYRGKIYHAFFNYIIVLNYRTWFKNLIKCIDFGIF